MRVKITFKDQQTSSIRKSTGPISMQFEIPMFNESNLQVRYLRILENHKIIIHIDGLDIYAFFDLRRCIV